MTPDELADETLNRVARRLEEEGEIESDAPAKYCYIVARFVFMESLRSSQKESVLLNDVRRTENGGALPVLRPDNEKEIKEKMLDCLEKCMEKLEKTSREIIIRYYYGEERLKIENRRRLAESLAILLNALSIRACRIRDKLEACVQKCVE